jgi:hypothetical protein
MVDILMPYAESPSTAVGLAPRLGTLSGATIGIVNNSWRCMNVVAAGLTDRLRSEYGVGRIVEERISAAQTLPDDVLERMIDECDAVVVGIGN